MPKITTKKLTVKERKLEVGDVVSVVTKYKVKRFDSKLTTLVAVEDAYGDRVLNFRIEELKREES